MSTITALQVSEAIGATLHIDEGDVRKHYKEVRKVLTSTSGRDLRGELGENLTADLYQQKVVAVRVEIPENSFAGRALLKGGSIQLASAFKASGDPITINLKKEKAKKQLRPAAVRRQPEQRAKTLIN